MPKVERFTECCKPDDSPASIALESCQSREVCSHSHAPPFLPFLETPSVTYVMPFNRHLQCPVHGNLRYAEFVNDLAVPTCYGKDGGGLLKGRIEICAFNDGLPQMVVFGQALRATGHFCKPTKRIEIAPRETESNAEKEGRPDP
jgi:hypothetical protein